MEDTDQPDAYFKRFEDIMKEAEIEKEEWPRWLSVLLSGKALVAYANTVPMEAKGDYNALKEALLQALGLTAEHCRLDVWTLNKRYGESWQELARRIDSMISRGTQGYKTLEEVNNIMAMYKFLSLCPADAVNYVQVRQPKSALEAANLVQDFLRRKYQERRSTPWNRFSQGSDNHHQDDRRRQEGHGGSNQDRSSNKYNPSKFYDKSLTISNTIGSLLALHVGNEVTRATTVQRRRMVKDNLRSAGLLLHVQSDQSI